MIFDTILSNVGRLFKRPPVQTKPPQAKIRNRKAISVNGPVDLQTLDNISDVQEEKMEAIPYKSPEGREAMFQKAQKEKGQQVIPRETRLIPKLNSPDEPSSADEARMKNIEARLKEVQTRIQEVKQEHESKKTLHVDPDSYDEVKKEKARVARKQRESDPTIKGDVPSSLLYPEGYHSPPEQRL